MAAASWSWPGVKVPSKTAGACGLRCPPTLSRVTPSLMHHRRRPNRARRSIRRYRSHLYRRTAPTTRPRPTRAGPCGPKHQRIRPSPNPSLCDRVTHSWTSTTLGVLSSWVSAQIARTERFAHSHGAAPNNAGRRPQPRPRSTPRGMTAASTHPHRGAVELYRTHSGSVVGDGFVVRPFLAATASARRA